MSSQVGYRVKTVCLEQLSVMFFLGCRCRWYKEAVDRFENRITERENGNRGVELGVSLARGVTLFSSSLSLGKVLVIVVLYCTTGLDRRSRDVE